MDSVLVAYATRSHGWDAIRAWADSLPGALRLH